MGFLRIHLRNPPSWVRFTTAINNFFTDNNIELCTYNILSLDYKSLLCGFWWKKLIPEIKSQAVADPLASLSIQALSSSMFSDDLTYPDDFLSFDNADFDITFDDIQLPSDTEDFFNSTFNPTNLIDLSSSDPEFNAFMMVLIIRDFD
ncbi:hypothetical protein L1887_36261 [Cichorium endivia]|nr:hypothetical protein L1887_36261 [Cichorium endivia]